MKFILGRKIGMTRVFDDDGRSFAVTKIAALPCEISQIKDKDKNGYKAVQISAYAASNKVGAGVPASAKRNAGQKIVKIAEFKETNLKKYKIGDKVDLSQFKKNESVTVEGIAKGKGFAGTIKRHDFSRGPVSHGSKNVRKPGSIGGGYPQRVVLGRKMAGHMGTGHVTIKNLRIIDVEDEMMLIAGAIPGPVKSIIKIYGKGEKIEEVVDHAAEEEKLAQERMLEADKEAKEAKAEDGEKDANVANEEAVELKPE